MPYTIIKTPKSADCEREVLGEFADESEAQKFAEESRANDSGENEYRVEVPPSITPDDVR